MKNIMSLTLLITLIFFSCTKEAVEAPAAIETPAPPETVFTKVVMIHPQGYRIRSTPGADSFPFTVKYMEEMNWTGKTEKAGAYTWWEIQSGEVKGWCHELFAAEPDDLALLIEDAFLYDEPSITGINAQGKIIPRAQLIAVREDTGSFLSIKWTDASGNWGEGYIKKTNLSTGAEMKTDMEALDALKKLKAGNLAEAARDALLKDVISNYSQSNFYRDIKEFKDSLSEESMVVKYPLNSPVKVSMDGVNLRSEATTDSDALTMLNKGQSAQIISVMNKLVKVQNYGPDYWYKIQGMAGDDIFEGWIFGTFLNME